jgi:predicted type IV restriction endonuclease
MEEQVKERIEQLITKYKNLPLKLRKQYNEASTKNSFIQPLFEALGWDFSDISEVEPEQRIAAGRVDYVFKINGVSKFCLEVKPLRDELNDDDRRQAISYAYNKGVSWAVLSNFDRLQVFNAERQTLDLNSILFLNLTCEDYLSDFNDL